jgi:uncharacterized membrane protein YfcA
MDPLEAIGLAAAAFAASAINSVAGGGSLVSFPALLAAGYPAKVANVTNTVAIWPGYLGGSFGYRDELRRQRTRVAALAMPSIAGAIVGAALLLATSGEAFETIVPFLVLLGAGLMAFQDPLSRWATGHRLVSRGDDHVPVTLIAFVFVGAVYGGYFGAGLGVVLLAVLTILLPDDIQHSNALKGMLTLLINATAVVSFAIFGPVEWGPALVMAGGSLAGGYLGVGIARALGPVYLKWAVVAFGVIVAVVLLVT